MEALPTYHPQPNLQSIRLPSTRPQCSYSERFENQQKVEESNAAVAIVEEANAAVAIVDCCMDDGSGLGDGGGDGVGGSGE